MYETDIYLLFIVPIVFVQFCQFVNKMKTIEMIILWIKINVAQIHQIEVLLSSAPALYK